MTIDYNKQKEIAGRLNISVFCLIKRILGYGKKVTRGMCKNCEFVCIPEIEGIKRMQCTLVGVGDDYYADVNPTWGCKHGFKIRSEKLKVISDYLKIKEETK